MAYSSYAVTNTTAGRGSPSSASSTPKPSSSGICTSRNASSGRSVRMSSTASGPFRASPTSVRLGSAVMNVFSPRLTRGSSSATSTRITRPSVTGRGGRRGGERDRVHGNVVPLVIRELERDANPRHEAAFVAVRQRELVVCAIEPVEPSLRRGEPHAVSWPLARSEPGTIVADLEHEPLPVPPRMHVDAADACVRAHPMLDRVLDEGLKNEIRHEG